MKILIANETKTAHYYIRLGLARAFSACGHEVVMWDINTKPTFDAFDEFEPDIFIGQTYNINRGWIKAIAERPHLRVILKGSDWGTISDTIDRQKYPVLIANEQEIENVYKLMEEAGKPDFVYCHYLEDRIKKETHNHWEENGIRAESLLSGADIFEFTGGKSKPEYECDIGFIGGRWGYKSRVLDKWFIPLCSPEHNYKIKIFGNQSWGVPQYCGMLPGSETKDFLASCKITPSLSEPHSQDLGYDIIERPYKLWANKCLCISDNVEDLRKLYPRGIYAKDPEHFKRLVNNYLNNKINNVEEVIETNYKHTIDNHTYFHRIVHIFNKLDLPHEAKNVMITYEDIKKGMKL